MKEVIKTNILEEPAFEDKCKKLNPYELRWLDAYFGEASFNLTSAERMAGSKDSSENAVRIAARCAKFDYNILPIG